MRLARDEPALFAVAAAWMRAAFDQPPPANLLAAMRADPRLADVDDDQLRRIHAQLWIVTQGLASMIRPLDADPAQGGITLEAARDGVVVTAGVGVFGAIADTTDGAWRAAIDHNLTGPFHLLRAVIPFLAENASVVTVASTNAVAPLRFEGAYSAAKSGLVAMSQSLALELAPKVRVNVVSHGLIDTPFIERVTGDADLAKVAADATPLGRIGSPQESIGLIEFLLGSQAGYITGQHFVIDGGGTLPRSQSDAVMRQISLGFAT